MRRRRRQGGFSLLEVLVAFAVLSLTLGVLMQVFSRAVNTTVLSGALSRAAALAEARLNAVGLDIPLVPGSYTGDPEDGLGWEVFVVPYEPGESAWESPFTPYVVTAVARWGEGEREREVSLTSLRLGEPL